MGLVQSKIVWSLKEGPKLCQVKSAPNRAYWSKLGCCWSQCQTRGIRVAENALLDPAVWSYKVGKKRQYCCNAREESQGCDGAYHWLSTREHHSCIAWLSWWKKWHLHTSMADPVIKIAISCGGLPTYPFRRIGQWQWQQLSETRAQIYNSHVVRTKVHVGQMSPLGYAAAQHKL